MPTHQSLQRAVAILREFSESDPALTVSEVSRRLDLHKSTVSRILATLLEEGLVWHNAETGRYSLGMGLVEMAGVALGQIDVRAAAMPHMADLVAELDETVAVVARRDRGRYNGRPHSEQPIDTPRRVDRPAQCNAENRVVRLTRKQHIKIIPVCGDCII